MIQLIIFDFDDTLTDNMTLDYNAFKIPCTKLGLKPPTKNMIIHERKKGLLASEIMQKFLKSQNKNQLNNFLINRKKFLDTENSLNYLRLKKGTRQFLEFLKTKKVKIIICTARKNKRFFLNFLKNRKVYTYFSSIYHSEDINLFLDNLEKQNRIQIKNNLIKEIIKNEKVNSSEILYVGNSIEDLTVAEELDIDFIYFQNSYLEKLDNSDVLTVTSMNILKKEIERLI